MKRCSVFILSSLGRFLLPWFPRAFSLNKRWSPRWWISQAGGLPDAGARLSRVVRGATRLAGASQALQTCSSCVYTQSPKLLLSEQPWPLFARAETVKQKKKRERENKWACFRAAFGLWVCEEATAASQRHFTATPKVEQLFFHWGWKARWANDIEMTLCCSRKPLFELLYLFWISTQSVLPLYTSKI